MNKIDVIGAKFMQLQGKDFIKGIVTAILTAFLNALMVVLGTGVVPTIQNIRTYALVGLSAGIGYLIKNLFTNSKDQLLKGEK